MMAASGKNPDMRSLCRQMVERCDEYQAARNTPERATEADEIRKDIVRLYSKIAVLMGT